VVWWSKEETILHFLLMELADARSLGNHEVVTAPPRLTIDPTGGDFLLHPTSKRFETLCSRDRSSWKIPMGASGVL
jgi:hypothetical protein